MLSPWLELPSVPERLAQLSDAAGVDLRTHGTVSDADTIRDTAIAQPLIVAASVLTAELLGAELLGADLLPDAGTHEGTGASVASALPAAVTAGHSVGEFAAAVVAGVLSAEQALHLVGIRGAAMAEAAGAAPTGMSAVLGGDPEEVAAALDRAGLVAANVNGGGQVVAAGTREALERLSAEPPARARVVPLQVAGAFHTGHMAPAVAELEAAASRLRPADPTTVLLTNADGTAVATGTAALQRMVAQLSNPVRWDLCQETLRSLGVTAVLELAPGGVLTGLARRTLPGVELVAVKSPDDLDAARNLLRRHGSAHRSAGPAQTAGPAGATTSKEPEA